MPYEVSTPVFEGPFDLLLHLLLKEEVDLWEISLARIVDAFCAEVERMQRLDLETATEFLLIAATLVELKARRLLPGRDDVDLDHVAPIRASVRDAVETVLALLPATGPIRFRDLTLGAPERLEIIVRFLAVLELFKQGVIELEQTANFGDLVVLPLSPDERVELDLESIADLDGEARPARSEPDRVGEHA